MPLYDIKTDPFDRAMGGLEAASRTTAAMDKKEFMPPKTTGGAVMSGLGAGLAGASLGASATAAAAAGGTSAAAMTGMAALGATGVGAIALGIGLLAYYLS